MSSYAEFLASKRRDWPGCGIDVPENDLPSLLFPFQRRLVRWALRKGRAAIFSTTGTGKTFMQASWAARIPGRVLILAPLCVSPQTVTEAQKIGIAVGPLDSGSQIEITNYERLHLVTPSQYQGIVLDESSRIKAHDRKTRTRLIAAFRETPWRLCCTATPAPNDIAELANHCEFLGIMSRAEMLATFFVHDEQEWRLKGHAHEAFFRWLASWGMFLRRPSDLSFDDDGFILPPLTIHDVVVGNGGPAGGALFPEFGLAGISGRLRARRESLSDRIEATLELVRKKRGPWILWCDLNAEQDTLAKALGREAASVAGADSLEEKETAIMRFLSGDARILLSKPRVAGFGLNFQHCHQVAFVGLSDSWEAYFQAIRRCWRFGQKHPVHVWIVFSRGERVIVENVRRKEAEAETLADGLVRHVADAEREELGMTVRQHEEAEPRIERGENWELRLGDCVERLREITDETIDLSVYSPPFCSLYTYSNTERDLGNCSNREEFLAHFAYVVRELLRTTKPGRLSCCHIAPTATTKATHGVIGFDDLRGAVIQCFVREGWVWQGEFAIDRDPQAVAIRTHAKGLMFVQLKKDAAWLRPAMADFVELFRKPGDNAVPVQPDVSNEEWIQWARPIWYGVRESNTLSVHEARENDDDRHICPLTFDVIERCVRLWSNPGELVCSPFAGIGSEGYVAVKYGRRFTGIELKTSYFNAACKNLRTVEAELRDQGVLFERRSS